MTASISDLFEFCFGEEELPNDTSPPIARIAIGRDRLTMSVALAREDCHSEGAYVQALSAQLRECIILGYEFHRKATARAAMRCHRANHDRIQTD